MLHAGAVLGVPKLVLPQDALRHASRVKKPDEDDIQVHSTSFSNRAAIYFVRCGYIPAVGGVCAYSHSADGAQARKQYERVIADCEAALNVWPSNVRACFRASRSHLLLEHWESAAEFAQRGLALDPTSKVGPRDVVLCKQGSDHVPGCQPLKRIVTQANKQLKAIARKKVGNWCREVGQELSRADLPARLRCCRNKRRPRHRPSSRKHKRWGAAWLQLALERV